MHRTAFFSHLGTAVCLGVWLCTQLTAPVAAQDRISAKVGIQIRSGAQSTLAKSTETVKAGDFLRVYVVPEDDAYVYVVHNDGKAPSLLNTQSTQTKVPKGSLITLPAPEEFYKIDGTSDTESITVICSPAEMPEVTSLFRTINVPQKSWTSLEKELIEKSRIVLEEKPKKPFQIGGSVRGLQDKTLVDALQIFSGNNYVVKKYAFQVQK